jgi:tRNA1Val (adenine37-N6)-methyltransferase
MGTFRFKKFEVVNEKSAMKVNTDGVLLGASMTIKSSDRNFLDIGTGTGTIALMAAQRFSELSEQDGQSIFSNISAIDIDEASATEAAMNFAKSPWSEYLHAHHSSLEEFTASDHTQEYDLIFSNPPYFEESLNAPELRRNNARHTSTGLSYREILDFASSHLSEHGRVAFVLPAETENALCRHARMDGLHLFRIVRIKTVPRKAPSRIIAEFSRGRVDVTAVETLIIQDEGKYTEEYLSLMHEFYIFA